MSTPVKSSNNIYQIKGVQDSDLAKSGINQLMGHCQATPTTGSYLC